MSKDIKSYLYLYPLVPIFICEPGVEPVGHYLEGEDWLEDKFEECFDKCTAPTGGGYEADWTDRGELWKMFLPFIKEALATPPKESPETKPEQPAQAEKGDVYVALQELVYLKSIKDIPDYKEEYERRKPLAWAAAKLAISSTKFAARPAEREAVEDWAGFISEIQAMAEWGEPTLKELKAKYSLTNKTKEK
jgi:hypothetical protein